MRLDSCRSLKAALSFEARTDIEAFHAATEPPMPPGVALGVAREGSEYRLAVRTDDPAKAAAITERAAGETDVRIVTVSKRPASEGPAYYQARRRPLEPGVQVGMAGKGFVGTLGCFVRDSRGLHVLSNSHVLADEGTAAPGHRIGQPFGSDLVAVLARFVPFSRSVPNLVDAAIARLNQHEPAITGWTSAINGGIRGVRAVTPDDLGREVFKAGRTTAQTSGRITVVEMDGVHVAYDVGTLVFNDQVEISGGPAVDFSAPGDSGSLIVDGEGHGVGLLFAGGRDSAGEDRTYANRLSVALEALGVTLA